MSARIVATSCTHLPCLHSCCRSDKFEWNRAFRDDFKGFV